MIKFYKSRSVSYGVNSKYISSVVFPRKRLYTTENNVPNVIASLSILLSSCCFRFCRRLFQNRISLTVGAATRCYSFLLGLDTSLSGSRGFLLNNSIRLMTSNIIGNCAVNIKTSLFL
nr:MAG TPA: hypothetical protein [Caudoviricetes sp.]